MGREMAETMLIEKAELEQLVEWIPNDFCVGI
jgi:hypothetical protein